jgi:hypothetical protein
MTLRTITGLFAIAISLTLGFGCKKTNSPFGKEVYDPDLLLDAEGIDTFSVIAFSELIDTTFSRNARFGLLGAYNDPVFGIVAGSIFTQLRLASDNPDFGDLSTITVDSVVLAMEYRDQYGIGNVPQSFAVFRVLDALTADSNYTTKSSSTTQNNSLIAEGFSTVTPNVLLRPVVGEDTLLPQLRLRLRNDFGWELLQSSADGHMVDNNAFLTQFKGLNIKTEDANIAPNSGAVYSLDLIDPDSKLIIYYTQNDVQKTFDLIINSNTVYYNKVSFDYSGTPLSGLIQNSLLGTKEFYAQTANVRAIVRFPGVMNLNNKTVIHRATLYLPVTYFNGDDRYPSPSLVAVNRRGDGDLIWGLSQQNNTISPTLHPFIPQFKRYTIDVTSFIQGLIKDEDNRIFSIPEIMITGSRTNDNVERIVFNGVESSNKFKPKLIITYTEF